MKKLFLIIIISVVWVPSFGQSARQVSMLTEMDRFNHDFQRFEDIGKAAWANKTKNEQDVMKFQIGTVRFKAEAFIIWLKNTTTTDQMMTRTLDELSQLVLYFQELTRAYDLYPGLHNDLSTAHLRSMDVSLRRISGYLVEGKSNQRMMGKYRLSMPASRREDQDASIGTIARYLKTPVRREIITTVVPLRTTSGKRKALQRKGLDSSECTPPGGNTDRAVIKAGLVTSWSNCLMTVKFDDGTSQTVFAGFGNEDTTPAINAAVTVSFDPTTNQVFYLRFERVYPFKQSPAIP